MDEMEKSVIQQRTRHIADGIMMNEEILSGLLEKNIFPLSMIEIIRSQTTPTKQAYKMLELLPKRGPTAFHGFIEVIQTDYPWIATQLLTELEDKQTAQHSSHNNGANIQGKKIETEYVDIRDKVNTFVHKHFGQSKKLAEKEKKLISKFLKTELTNERVRLELLDLDQSATSETDNVSEGHETYTLAYVKEELYNLHVKIKNFLPVEDSKDGNNVFGESVSFFRRESQMEDMTFPLIYAEVSKLCDAFAKTKRDIDACLSHFESSNRANGLPLLVESLVLTKNKHLETIDQMEKRNADLIDRLGEMTEEVHNLEMQRVQRQRQLDAQTRELSKLRHEKYTEHDRSKQLEKEKQEHKTTIEELKTQISQLQHPRSLRTKRGELSKSPTRKSNPSFTYATNYKSTTNQSYNCTPMFSELKKRASTNDPKLSVKYKR